MDLMQMTDLGDGWAKGVLPVTGHHGLPVWTLQGKAHGPTLVLTAGVHGCEYVGILTLRRLFSTLDPTMFSGRILMLPLVNSDGFYAGSKQVVPSDGKNINRVFPPPSSGTQAEAIAHSIQTEIYPQADFLLDLHGGDVNERMMPLVFFPATASPEITRQARDAAQHLQVPYRIPSSAKNGLYSYGAQQGIPALLLEIGGQGLWNHEQIELECRSILSLMGWMNMGPTSVRWTEQQETVEMQYVEAETNGLWIPAVQEGKIVSCGQLLGTVEDLDGAILQTVRARYDGVVLYYTVSLGVSTGDALVAYGRCGTI